MSEEDRQDLHRVVAAIKEARGGSPDAAANSGGIAAREFVADWLGELPAAVRVALEAILLRDEAGPEVGAEAPDFCLKRLGTEDRVRLSDYRGRRSVALPSAATLDPRSALSLSA